MRTALLSASLLAALAACGGGGGDATGSGATASPGAPTAPTSPPSPSTPATTTYANSVVVGSAGTTPSTQPIVYRAAAGVDAATVTTTSASALLPAGSTPVLAEHVDPAFAGVRVVCVSGRGETTNVVGGIDLGVIAESAAVLLDASWHAVDAETVWRAASAAGAAWLGWENCGVKPEGLPSPSSRLVARADGGYVEDVYDGNPGTTFNVVRRAVPTADVAAMLSTAGATSREDPLRPLVLVLRAYANDAGRTVLVESGTPVAGAPASVRGFVALYVPA